MVFNNDFFSKVFVDVVFMILWNAEVCVLYVMELSNVRFYNYVFMKFMIGACDARTNFENKSSPYTQFMLKLFEVV